MQNLSVVISDDSKRFLDSLIFEDCDEIRFCVNDELITFYDINEKNLIFLCGIIAKAIIHLYERRLLVKAINKKCEKFSKYEKIEIWKIAITHLRYDIIEHNTEYLERVILVEDDIYQCFSESTFLSLEGLMNFRLKKYLELLEDAAVLSAKEYEIDREYKEFVMMLKYYISLQTPKFNNVQVFYGKDVQIFGDGKNVTEEYEEEYKSEMGVLTENKDDFVLNSLILIAPSTVKLIITDVVPEKEFVDTLKGVFQNKLSIKQ